MKIWYDACTGKHIRYGAALAKHFRKRGHDFVFTTRAHPDTVRLAKILGEDPHVVGKYSPNSLLSRLEESAVRMKGLAALINDEAPDVAVAHQSVELCRVAFGLGIPVVLTADTPHAHAVNKLTVPLADALVVSEAIPERIYRDCCATKILSFKGVDEVAWIKGPKPSWKSRLQRPLIVVRQIETKASYAPNEKDQTTIFAKKLSTLGNVILLSRYDRFDGEFIDSASLAGLADLVVSAGGTLSREAALQGVPSLVVSDIGKTYVNNYLSRLGFPLFFVDPKEVITRAKKLIGNRYNVKKKLNCMESPVGIIEETCLTLSRGDKKLK
jgi:uncharacterized protein